MKVVHARHEHAVVDKRVDTFTGDVWADPVMPKTDDVLINNVYFGPCGRTHWHYHDGGQILIVTSGTGWVATREGSAEPIRTGDTIWTPPGEHHWHGSEEDSFLVHTAISLGTTQWLEEVSPEEYARATAGVRG